MARRLDDKVGPAVGQLPHRLAWIARRRVNGRVGAQPFGDVATQRHRVDDDHARAHADGSRRRNETDGPSARDHDRLGSVGRAIAQDRIEAAGERLDQRAFRVIDRIRQLVEPFGPGGEILAVCAVHREAEMMDTLGRLDHALADDAVTGLEAGDVLADFDDLADPFMTRDDGVGNRDDVLAGEKLVVRVADADATRADHHFICGDRRRLDLRDDRLLWFVEEQGFHRSLPSSTRPVRPRFRSCRSRADAKTASSNAILLTRCSAVIG